MIKESEIQFIEKINLIIKESLEDKRIKEFFMDNKPDKIIIDNQLIPARNR